MPDIFSVNEAARVAANKFINGDGAITAVTITRPANVTAYGSTAVVGGVLTIPSVGPANSPIMITGTRLELDISSVPSGMTSFTLHLYSSTPPSAYTNGSTWDLPSGDRASYIGNINIGVPVDLGSTLYVESNQINKLVKLVGGSTLYGYLVTNTGYTPAANSEVYLVTIATVAI